MYTSTALTLAAAMFNTAIAQTTSGDALSDVLDPARLVVPSGSTNVVVSPNTQSLGDLAGDDLVNKVTNLLQTACSEPTLPDTATPCAADPAGLSIDGVAVITNLGEILGGGSIILTIKEGNYSYAAQRDGMIATFVQTLKVAAAGTNCQTDVHWQSGCSLGVSGGGKRSNTLEEPRIKGRRPSPLLQGTGPEQDCQRGTKTICSGPDNVNIEIDAVNGGEKLAVLNVDIAFEDPYVPFGCASMLTAIGTGVAAFGFVPAVAVGAIGVALGSVSAACG